MSVAKLIWAWQTKRLEGRCWLREGQRYVSIRDWRELATKDDQEALKDLIRRLDGQRNGWHKPDTVLAQPGVYAIFDGRSLLYVGSSLNLASRLSGHPVRRQYRQANIRVRYTKRGDHLSAEFKLIERLQPKLNKTWVDRRRRSDGERAV